MISLAELFIRKRARRRLILFEFTIVFICSLTIANLVIAADGADSSIVLTPQIGHNMPVTDISVSPDGQYLVSASADRSLVLWDATSSVEIRRFEGYAEPVTSIAVDWDNFQVLGSSPHGYMILWDLKTGARLHQYSCSGKINSVALDPKGRYLVAGTDQGIFLLDRENEVMIRRLDKFNGILGFGWYRADVSTLAFSPDGNRVVTGSDKDIREWDVTTGNSIENYEGLKKSVTAVVYSPDGNYIISASDDGAIRLWQPGVKKNIDQFNANRAVKALAVTPDSRYVIGALADSELVIWNRNVPGEFKTISTYRQQVNSLALDANGVNIYGASIFGIFTGGLDTGYLTRLIRSNSNIQMPQAIALDGKRLYVGTYNGISEWDLNRGQFKRLLRDSSHVATSLAIDSRRRQLLSGSSDSLARLFVLGPRTRLYEVPSHHDRVTSVALNADADCFLTGSNDSTVVIWRRPKGETSPGLYYADGRIRLNDKIRSLAVDREGRYATVACSDGILTLDLAKKKKLRRLKREDVQDFWDAWSVAYSPNNRYVLGSSTSQGISLWDLKDKGREVRYLPETAYTAIFDSSGDFVYSGGASGRIGLWDLDSRALKRIYLGHSNPIRALSASDDGRYLFSASRDGTVKVWNTDSEEPLASLMISTNGGKGQEVWMVVGPDGRFDTNRLEGVEGLYWTISDEPMKPLPLEMFMRDYYQPELLRLLMDGSPLPPLRDLSTLNRILPSVKIPEIVSIPGHADSVLVTVMVTNKVGEVARDGQNTLMTSGIHDLRLYRDGQLVGQFPNPLEYADNSGYNDEKFLLKQWRNETTLGIASGESATVKFRVRIPVRTEVSEVEFTAYAFNSDRVKGETATNRWSVPNESKDEKRTAYVLTIGVSDNLVQAKRLENAASDAILMRDMFTNRLISTNLFSDSVLISLIAAGGPNILPILGGGDSTFPMPSKKNIHDVFSLLANEYIKRPQLDAKLKDLVGASNRPGPDDLLLIIFSGHGMTDPATGEFFLVPYDMCGSEGNEFSAEARDCMISSRELSNWLRPIDAGQIILILGSCYSESAISQNGFKPGPMGDRSFGQLAYDKGMQILAASASRAWVIGTRSLLTYALAVEGPARMDSEEISPTLTGMLDYATLRLPELYEENRGKRGWLESFAQQPRLFDFRKNKVDLRLK